MKTMSDGFDDENENRVAEKLDNADESRDNFFSILSFLG